MDPALLWNALTTRPLFLDETRQQLVVDRVELEKDYLPLAEKLLERAPVEKRLLVAVVGPPGSGKSAFATLLAAVINLLAQAEPAVVVGLDGWHYPNAYLNQHTMTWHGKKTVLRALKGMPETYDFAALAKFIQTAVTASELQFPIYSRALHDPLTGAGTIKPQHRIILAEGNYWLLNELPWNSLANHFDFSIFLQADPAVLLNGLRQRHLRGGKSLEQIEAHLQQVDLPNIHRVLTHSLPADVIVQKVDHQHIANILWSRSCNTL